MSAFSDEMAATALSLITEFGEAVSFVQTTEGAYDPATATTGTPSTAAYSGFGVPTDYDKRDIDGTLVQQQDTRLYVHNLSTVPGVGDKCTLDSIDYRIMDIRQYVINSAVVLYELQLRI